MPCNKSHDVPIACHRCTPGPDPPEACKGSSCCYFKKMSTDFKENEASIFYISKRNCKCTQKGCYVRFSSTIKESNTPKTSKLAVHQLLVVHQILCRTISVNLPRVELLNFYWKEHGDSTCAGLVCVLRSYKTYFMYQLVLDFQAHVCFLSVNVASTVS